MGDLIRRSKVIDVLKETGIIIDNDLGHLVVDEIERIPTSYDVEKVVQCIHKYFTKKINDCKENIVPHEILEYNKELCEIVRKGGVE